MQKADAINNMAYAQFQTQIGSPQRDKALKMQKDDQMKQEMSMQNLNMRAAQAHDFKNKLLNDHNSSLRNQLNTNQQSK